jgi:uncharacterized membrane protein YccC
MKYAIRRLIAGVIAIPVIAGTYTAFYLFLILAGAEPTMTLEETFGTGINIAIALAVALVFYPQISNTLDKVLY